MFRSETARRRVRPQLQVPVEFRCGRRAERPSNPSYSGYSSPDTASKGRPRVIEVKRDRLAIQENENLTMNRGTSSLCTPLLVSLRTSSRASGDRQWLCWSRYRTAQPRQRSSWSSSTEKSQTRNTLLREPPTFSQMAKR